MIDQIFLTFHFILARLKVSKLIVPYIDMRLAFLLLLLVKDHPAASRQFDTNNVVVLTENMNNVMVLEFISNLLRHCIVI